MILFISESVLYYIFIIDFVIIKFVFPMLFCYRYNEKSPKELFVFILSITKPIFKA